MWYTITSELPLTAASSTKTDIGGIYMNEKVAALLNDQINKEFYSAYL